MSEEERGLQVRGYRVAVDWTAIRGAILLTLAAGSVLTVAYFIGGAAGVSPDSHSIYSIFLQTMWGIIVLLVVIAALLVILLAVVLAVETFFDVEAVDDE